MLKENYSQKNIRETLSAFKSSLHGLSHIEATDRLKQYAVNDIESNDTSWLKIMLRQFKSPFIYLQIFAVIISFLLGETNNGIMILIFTLINISLGFVQEYKAQKAVGMLKELLPQKVSVIRDNQEIIIPKKYLVPGDLVILKAGMVIPADLRLIKVNNLMLDESALTGESLPVNKITGKLTKTVTAVFDAKNIAFTGTMIVSGEGLGIVVSTGYQTEYGQISQTLNTVERESVYEKDLLSFSKLILRIILVTIFLIFTLNFAVKGEENWYEFLIFCIALIVSIVPEALPVVVSWSLSQGAMKLAKSQVIVKRLSAIEDLGNMEILCSDKTGTLTENHLTLKKIESSDPDSLLSYGLLAIGDTKTNINPFALALNRKTNKQIIKQIAEYKIIHRLPFDSNRMRSSVLVQAAANQNIFISMGAPEKILAICSRFRHREDRAKIIAELNQYGKKGYRTLAIAFKKTKSKSCALKDEKNMQFLGFFVFHNPLKPTASSTIGLARKLGLQIKIITGDSLEVAGDVARKIGLIDHADQVILGEDLEKLSNGNFDRACRRYHVFARVAPQIKLKIVQSLQKDKEVGYIGDGINDAPALKASNLAISADNATDVAREVSDIVLLEKDLHVIIEGVKQGRNIFANINKYIKCTLASNFGNSYSLAIISLLIPYLPMLAIQLLLVNLLSDFPLIAVASDSVDAQELRRPKAYQLSQTIFLVIGLAIISSAFDVVFFLIFRQIGEHQLQTLWFIESILTEIALIYSIRTTRWFWQAKLPGRPLLFFTIIALFLTLSLPFTSFGQYIFYFIPPGAIQIVTVISLVTLYFILSELFKHRYYIRQNKNHQRISNHI